MSCEVWTQEDMKKYLGGGTVPKRTANQPKVLSKAHQRPRYQMNKGETRYADYLRGRLWAGAIQWFGFEAIKVRLADNTFVTPDFMIVAADGVLELHDVKGRKVVEDSAGRKIESYFCEEDAKIKLKVLAEQFPARVKIVWPDKSGVWQEEIL